MDKKVYEFQTLTKKMLHLMIHSVYTNPDIFLRELISNASDAIDKLRFASLTEKSYEEYVQDPYIRITPSKEKTTISVYDTGIGMDREDLVEYLGTIAKSGSQEIIERLKEAGKDEIPPELIGQFGVGFYSSFMVADKVRVITRKAGTDKTWRWESDGDGSFEIEEIAMDDPLYRGQPGTTVLLHMKDDEDMKEYATEWKIRTIVKKYSDFVEYPIKMFTDREEYPKDEEGKTDYKAEPEIKRTDETINSMKAIWTRPEEDVTEEEYNEFYKHVAHDWQPPQRHFYMKGEGITEFRALLFIPSQRPWGMWNTEMDHGLSLYIRNVFIMNDYKDLIPQYLRFIRGVVDSEDLSLNISRESLQQNKTVELIKKGLVRKILRELSNMLAEDRDEYLKFWNNFGAILKEGLVHEQKHKEDLFSACLFQSTNDPEKLTTIDEYIERMPEDQDTIYFITGKDRKALEASPHLEAFRKKGWEVLLLIDPVDEVWSQYIPEFKEKKLSSVQKGELNLEPESEEQRKEKQESYKDLTEFMQKQLEEHIKEVRITDRLTDSPACLVGEAHDLTPQLEEMLRSTGQEIPHAKRILEINPDHPVIQKMQTKFPDQKETLPDLIHALYAQSLIAEGTLPDNPAAFAKTLSKLLQNSL